MSVALAFDHADVREFGGIPDQDRIRSGLREGREGNSLVRPDLRDALSGEEGLRGVESPESRPESHEGHQCELGCWGNDCARSSGISFTVELGCWICLKELRSLRTPRLFAQNLSLWYVLGSFIHESAHGGGEFVDRKRLR